MITVDPKEYRLVYFRKKDGRKFLAKRVTGQEYVLYDTEENKKQRLSYHFLRKEFVSDSDNFKSVKQAFNFRAS
jgi:hypothetical protein